MSPLRILECRQTLILVLLKCTCFLPLNHCEEEASSLAHIRACFGVSSLIGNALHSIQQRLLVPVGAELELSPGIITELNDGHLSKRKLGVFIMPVVLELYYAELVWAKLNLKIFLTLKWKAPLCHFPQCSAVFMYKIDYCVWLWVALAAFWSFLWFYFVLLAFLMDVVFFL